MSIGGAVASEIEAASSGAEQLKIQFPVSIHVYLILSMSNPLNHRL